MAVLYCAQLAIAYPATVFPVITAMLSLQYGNMHVQRACAVELVWLPVSDTFDMLIMQGLLGTAV